MIKLSVLDLSPVCAGIPGAASLQNSLDLARFADRLGFHRYWVAEHHSLPSIASTSPEIMIGQIAAVTTHMRIGSGGVMLPNHAPLAVAERFKALEALFPGRIDLGLGRAPGTDPVTTFALRQRQEVRADDDFLERLQELFLWKSGGFPQTHPFRNVRVMPEDVDVPPILLLGSSDYSCQLAAAVGLGFAFAHHFASFDAVTAMRTYRTAFKASQWNETPHAILGVAAVCADTDEKAEYLASSVDLNFVRRSKGEYAPLAAPDDAISYPYTATDKERVRQNRSRLFVGGPDKVKAQLQEMAEACGADELMVTTMIYDHAARKRSFELLSEAFALARPSQ